MGVENKAATMSELLRQTGSDLLIQQITEKIFRFGGHPLRVTMDGCEQDFWSEFIRVKKDVYRTLVFRAITRLNLAEHRAQFQGIQQLTQQSPSIERQKVIILDHRTNMEREVDPGVDAFGSQHVECLRTAYRDLLESKIDLILTPVREGSLGPTQPMKNFGPFTEAEQKNNPNVWDIREEVELGQTLQLAFTTNREKLLQLGRLHILNHYQKYALPIAQLISGELQRLDFPETPENFDAFPVDLDFFDDVEHEKDINLGFGEQTVEQVIAYPYPTKQGVLYVRLFRVWNSIKDAFEVVRVLQTHSSLSEIDGFRIDSSCVDGVHSLDCHCDCKAQLEAVLYQYGFVRQNNVVVLQMADQEGKGWGTVLKGAGQHRLVREFNAKNPLTPIDHVDAESHFYNAMGMPPDNRNYGAAQAVVRFLGITQVTELLMDNQDKVRAMDAAGLTYTRVCPVYPDESLLSREARQVKRAKKGGKVLGTHGTVSYPGNR